MKLTSYLLPAAAVVVTAAAILASTTAQVNAAQQPAPPPAGQAPGHMHHPKPTNLQVLPKDISGEKLHETMEGWADALGGSCKTCHAEDPKNLAPNGRPRLNFADDSKPEKQIARKMYLMTEEINTQYISKIQNDGQPVTCGTCHRGHLGPQPFNPDATPGPTAAPKS